jgi:hypothetical protein
MARSSIMTKPNEANEYNLKDFLYEIVFNEENGESKPKPIKDVLVNHFLKPKPVVFAHQPQLKRTVLTVACGGCHMLVIASDNKESFGKLYTCGLNGGGQLGHGDSAVGVEYHALTLVRFDSNFCFVF